jgi:hypothetical protein
MLVVNMVVSIAMLILLEGFKIFPKDGEALFMQE